MNTSFLHNFLGLCMWGHISDGYMWMKRSDLGNDLKISLLYATIDVFKKDNPVLFKALMRTKGEKIYPNTVSHNDWLSYIYGVSHILISP